MMAKKRQEANREILELVKQSIEEHPDWRFHQILQNMGIEEPHNDQWHEESEETLTNAKRTLNGGQGDEGP